MIPFVDSFLRFLFCPMHQKRNVYIMHNFSFRYLIPWELYLESCVFSFVLGCVCRSLEMEVEGIEEVRHENREGHIISYYLIDLLYFWNTRILQVVHQVLITRIPERQVMKVKIWKEKYVLLMSVLSLF
jgi:hypothetical protein